MVFHSPVAVVAMAGNVGRYKVALSVWNMLLRGFMAGAYIAIGGALATVCSTGVIYWAGGGFAKLILGGVFPVGLIIIVLTGAELFTGDAMLAPMAAFIHKVSWPAVLNLWIWVYIGNLIGSVWYAYIMAYGPFTIWNAGGGIIASPEITAFGATALGIAADKVSYSGATAVWSAFLKAIGCNWLVNLAVLLGICADDMIGKFFGIWFPIMAFVSSGFEHCVANMYFIPVGLILKQINPDAAIEIIGAERFYQLTWGTMWTNNLIIVTLGNIIGGMFFVGVLYWVAFRDEIAAMK